MIYVEARINVSPQFLMELLKWTFTGPLVLWILNWKDAQQIIQWNTVTLMLLAHTQRESQEHMENLGEIIFSTYTSVTQKGEDTVLPF